MRTHILHRNGRSRWPTPTALFWYCALYGHQNLLLVTSVLMSYSYGVTLHYLIRYRYQVRVWYNRPQVNEPRRLPAPGSSRPRWLGGFFMNLLGPRDGSGDPTRLCSSIQVLSRMWHYSSASIGACCTVFVFAERIACIRNSGASAFARVVGFPASPSSYDL